MTRKREVLPPTTPLVCYHNSDITYSKTNTAKATVVSENRQHIKRSISLH